MLPFKLFISQFDFKPQNCILMGSSYHLHKQAPQIIEEQSKEYLRSKALLKSKKNLSLKSIKSKDDLSKMKTSTVKIGEAKASKNTEKMKHLLNSGYNENILIFEEVFLKEFRDVENKRQEVEIKFIRQVGELPIADSYKNKIIDQRNANAKSAQEFWDVIDDCRNEIEINRDKVVVPTDCKIEAKPNWDVYSTDTFANRRRYLDIFNKAGHIVLFRIIISKALAKLRVRLKKENISCREDAAQLVEDDWKNAHKILEREKQNLHFGFSIDDKQVRYDRFPIEYEINITSFKENVPVSTINSFDDSVPYNPIETLDFEQHKYDQIPYSGFANYFPMEDNRLPRKGCECEYFKVGITGDPFFTTKELTDELLSIPQRLCDPLSISSASILLPHPYIRAYKSLKSFSEVDIDYKLQSYEKQYSPLMDMHWAKSFPSEDIESLQALEGYSGIRAVWKYPIELNKYYKGNNDLPSCKI